MTNGSSYGSSRRNINNDDDDDCQQSHCRHQAAAEQPSTFTWSMELAALVAQLRPHQWIYVMVMGFVAWQLVHVQVTNWPRGVLAAFPASSWYPIITLAYVACTVPAQLFLQDAFTSRERENSLSPYFSVQSPRRRHYTLIAAVILLVAYHAMVIKITGHLIPAFLFLAQFGSAIAYAGLKHSNHPICAVIFRGLSGGFLMMHFMAIVADLMGIHDLLLSLVLHGSVVIVFMILMDAMVNLAGDIRDFHFDRQNGIQTMPVQWTEDRTVMIMHGMGMMAFLTFTTGVMLVLVRSLIIMTPVRVIFTSLAMLMFLLPHVVELYFRQWGPWDSPFRPLYHAVFHGSKLIIYSCLALILMSDGTLLMSLVIIALMFSAWILAYHAYIVSKAHTIASMTPPSVRLALTAATASLSPLPSRGHHEHSQP